MTLPLLEVRGVSKSFGGLRALNGVSFEVPAGKVVSIIGPNGAGKTTLFNVITGALEPTEGDVLFEGRSIKGLRPSRTARLGIGRTFQIVRPFPALTTLENVTLAALAKERGRPAAERRAREVLELTRLAPLANVQARHLTLARRKRLEIARAVALRPRLVLLDEVMAGLTPAEVDETIEMVRALPSLGIAAVAGIEHVMRAVRKISDWIVAIDFGRKVAEGLPGDVMRHPEVVKAYLGSRYADAAERS
jgi:ABC-type branched-subunit amino acid transport system ATPase component